MKKKNKAGSRFPVIAVILIAAALVLLFIFRGFLFGGKETLPSASVTAEKTDGQENTDSAEQTASGVRVALKDYDVWRLDDLDFVFVIADLHVSTDEVQTITLDHFVTDEGIALDQTGEYEKVLEEHGYYPGRRNVMFSLVSSLSEYDASVLIPVKDGEKETLSLMCDLEGVETMEMDLLHNVVTDGSSLRYGSDEVISDSETYRIVVRQALDITDEMFFMTDSDGSRVQYVIPSTDRVYAFEIEACALAEDSIVITDAEFIPEGDQSGYHAMAAGIRSMKETNIIGRTIIEEDSGFLFFDVYGPAYSQVSYKGILRLYLSNDIILNVNVNLN